MGYFVDADGTVRSEESVRKEIEENVRKVNGLSSSKKREKKKNKIDVKKNVTTTELKGTQQKGEVRTYCPVCCKWISGSMIAHMNAHTLIYEIKHKERQEKKRKVVVRSISIEKSENEKLQQNKHKPPTKPYVSKKEFLEKFFGNKKAGFSITIEKLNEIYEAAGGTGKFKKKTLLHHLKFVSLKKELELKFCENGIISSRLKEAKNKSGYSFHKTDSALKKKSGSKKRKHKSKTYQNNKKQSLYTATIADITGYDTHYANKGDWRFRDSNGQFGSTPLYDDYDN